MIRYNLLQKILEQFAKLLIKRLPFIRIDDTQI